MRENGDETRSSSARGSERIAHIHPCACACLAARACVRVWFVERALAVGSTTTGRAGSRGASNGRGFKDALPGFLSLTLVKRPKCEGTQGVNAVQHGVSLSRCWGREREREALAERSSARSQALKPSRALSLYTSQSGREPKGRGSREWLQAWGKP